jgi:hypothetical protein
MALCQQALTAAAQQRLRLHSDEQHLSVLPDSTRLGLESAGDESAIHPGGK